MLLIAALLFGLLASFAFLYPGAFNKFLPFYQLRPFHVSSALFWIITGATAGIIYYKKEAFNLSEENEKTESSFIVLWIGTILAIFLCYALRLFGGREYWEFPPVLSIPLLAGWMIFMISYYTQLAKLKQAKPLYIWMWSTGIFFFLITFVEQNLWQIPWFRSSFLKEITVQWKANGAIVGAWNQMIYGTALYLMVKISNNKTIAESRKAFSFYFLGLTNLMFNWGHHIYNVPAASWIRDISYIISMTEWVIFISIIKDFRWKLEERDRLKHLIPYRFIIASEFWVFVNLLLALLMSIPAINRYTHGTHITVAHAMGTTIGINTMILLGSLGYMLDVDEQSMRLKRTIKNANLLTQVSLGIFWLSLVVAGILKGYRSVSLNIVDFREMMKPVMIAMTVVSVSGIGLMVGLGTMAVCYLLISKKKSIGIELQHGKS